MDSCAVRLCDTLEGAAKEGREVDIFRALGTMTMGVSTLRRAAAAARAPSRALRAAVSVETCALANGS
jgi:hypothetical protein